MAAWKSDEKYAAFVFYSTDRDGLATAQLQLDTCKAKGGKTCVDWDGYRPHDGGFLLPWKQPATKGAGWAWFSRILGGLKKAKTVRKQSVLPKGRMPEPELWRVVGLTEIPQPEASQPQIALEVSQPLQRQPISPEVSKPQISPVPQHVDNDMWPACPTLKLCGGRAGGCPWRQWFGGPVGNSPRDTYVRKLCIQCCLSPNVCDNNSLRKSVPTSVCA